MPEQGLREQRLRTGLTRRPVLFGSCAPEGGVGSRTDGPVSKQQRPALANRRTAAPGRSSAWETPGADSTTIPRDRVDTATGTTFRGRPNLNTLLGQSASAWKEGSMDLHVGQRIVCVDVNFSRLPSPQRNLPLRDIRGINELVGLCLHEIVNASADFAEGYVEAASTADASGRFAPPTSKCSRCS
jgi:hypothetical protein